MIEQCGGKVFLDTQKSFLVLSWLFYKIKLKKKSVKSPENRAFYRFFEKKLKKFKKVLAKFKNVLYTKQGL